MSWRRLSKEKSSLLERRHFFFCPTKSFVVLFIFIFSLLFLGNKDEIFNDGSSWKAAGIGFTGTNVGGVARRPIGSAAPVSTAAAPVVVGGVSGSESAHLGGLAGLTSSSDDEGVDGHLGLGELAQLTVNNEAEVSYDVSRLH